MRFADKVVFITGGGIGFGRAFARAFVEQGATAVIAEIDDGQAKETVTDLRASGGNAMAVHCDVAHEDEVDAAVATVTGELGGIDILLNNAGLHLSKYNARFSALERNEIRDLFDVNVMGIINCSLACRDSMSERGGGSIVNISSVASDLSMSPYGVSKLAVRGLTVAFAYELSEHKIRVNAISPGLMATENALADLPRTIIDDQVNHRQMVHRLGEMRDVVEAALFLCSEEASFITGETLRVSGGFPMTV